MIYVNTCVYKLGLEQVDVDFTQKMKRCIYCDEVGIKPFTSAEPRMAAALLHAVFLDDHGCSYPQYFLVCKPHEYWSYSYTVYHRYWILINLVIVRGAATCIAATPK